LHDRRNDRRVRAHRAMIGGQMNLTLEVVVAPVADVDDPGESD
jgi:hypothetical protein